MAAATDGDRHIFLQVMNDVIEQGHVMFG